MDSNHRIRESKSLALPLGNRSIFDVEDRTCTCTSDLSGRRPTNRTYIVLLNPSHNITHLNDFNKYYKLNIEAKVSHLYDLL